MGLNVAIFTSAYHPSMGGVEEVVRQVTHEYVRQGVSVILITNRWPRSLPNYEVHEGIPVYRIAMRTPEYNLKVRLAYWLAYVSTRMHLMRIMRRHRIGLIHVHCASSNGHYALMARHALKLPLILTAHGERTMDAGTIYETSAFQNRILRQLVHEAAYITACSRHTLRDLEDYYGEPFGERSSVVYNGIQQAEFLETEPHENARPYVFAIGRLVPQKGFDILIEAFLKAKLATHDLLIAGDGSERDALASLVQKHGLGERVRLIGRADRKRVASLFKGCSFFVLPSRQEPLGIVNLEAMAAGKAVIASNTGGVPEIVADEETGVLVQPANVEALVQAIRRLAADPALRDRLGEAGRRRVADFTWASSAAQYLSIYGSILNPGPCQPSTQS